MSTKPAALFIFQIIVWLILLSSCATHALNSGVVVDTDVIPGSEAPETVTPQAPQSPFGFPLTEDRVFPGETVDVNGHVVPATSRTSSNYREDPTSRGADAIESVGMATFGTHSAKIDSGTDGGNQPAALIFRLPMGGNEPGFVHVKTNHLPRYDSEGEYAGRSETFVGVGDYASNKWNFQGPFSNGDAIIDCGNMQVVSGLGNTHVAVVVCNGSQAQVNAVTVRAKQEGLVNPPRVPHTDHHPIKGGAYLDWVQPASENVIGYNIHWSYVSFTHDDHEVAKLANDYPVMPPFIHYPSGNHENLYYSIAAIDCSGNESTLSITTQFPMNAFDEDEPRLALSCNATPEPSEETVAHPGAIRTFQWEAAYVPSGDAAETTMYIDTDGNGLTDADNIEEPDHTFAPVLGELTNYYIWAKDVADPDRQAVTTGSYWYGDILTVGPGRAYETIEDAYADASDGSCIYVFPKEGNAPYETPQLKIDIPNLQFIGQSVPGEPQVELDGTGFDYTGDGSTPQGIFHFTLDGSGGSVDHFKITGVHNTDHDAAGVFIQDANNITISNCEISSCDRGVASIADGINATGVNQQYNYLHVHDNGSESFPELSHNFDLGGTSTKTRGCEIGNSFGNNYQSDARFNRIEYCKIYHANNWEVFFGDSVYTEIWSADSVIVGCLIVKDDSFPTSPGVINFGGDGANDHRGTLYAWCNTIVTPLTSPVFHISSMGASMDIVDNLIWDNRSTEIAQQFVGSSGSGAIVNIFGDHNWLPHGMEIHPSAGFDLPTMYLATDGENPPWRGGDYPDVNNSADWGFDTKDPNIHGAGKVILPIALPVGTGQEPNNNGFMQYEDDCWVIERTNSQPDSTDEDIGSNLGAIYKFEFGAPHD